LAMGYPGRQDTEDISSTLEGEVSWARKRTVTV